MYGQIPYMMSNYAAPLASAASTGTKAASIFSKLNLGSILSTAQKTLNVVNQAIPLYYQVKPVFKNFKTIGKIGKELTRMNASSNNTPVNNTQSNTTNETNESKSEININSESNNVPNPSFFL